tara:strand:- start:152 stop:631 length:480 start_codon:yes stop_codon:yes gene_type:complete
MNINKAWKIVAESLGGDLSSKSMDDFSGLQSLLVFYVNGVNDLLGRGPMFEAEVKQGGEVVIKDKPLSSADVVFLPLAVRNFVDSYGERKLSSKGVLESVHFNGVLSEWNELIGSLGDMSLDASEAQEFVYSLILLDKIGLDIADMPKVESFPAMEVQP